MDIKVWIPFSCDNLAKVNVFCFHHAGGLASAYKDWVSECKQLNIYSMELPGKGTRMAEAPILTIDELTEQIAKAIESISVDKKVVLYGHSMGAAIAFTVANYLEKNTDIQLQLLIVASRQAPQCKGKDRYHSTMADHYLIQELQRLGGTPQYILENQEFLQFIIPSIKKDYRLHESFSYNGQKLNMPIIAHYGDNDPDLTALDMLPWQEVTNNKCTIKKFQGGHFFSNELGNAYFNKIEDMIMDHHVNVL